ncbi:probable 3-beta-hydroxysteroid-Delta(8),Delta(7)-isomerase [Selaginella moellendorffii]|uniref:probable 3-beta-hydroxysteroid-Delta(8),Delta(7)-isomerase n=1 Tax=Selaginella moellendorffii TaxID=88036 RepID=UPI000D1C2136|nr:probable 3-beta-hydroxysteroid-Delta(8),Delta(7)-isomerase [Selaginella moellendorffii]|eukprot:XP_024536757.1 probable 3-beta-hydroxysteroid-Delta(8),Delta(7)-isomerase [Selaginella moellendorffii]
MEETIPGFVPAQLSIASILAVYGSASALVIASIWILSRKYRYLGATDRLLMCWFAFSGLTHIILEGYFVFTPDFYKQKEICFLSEVWKEYHNGDSRYGARDPTVVIVEGITSVLAGPACLLAVYAIAKRKSYQYTLQLAVSLGQLYGDIVYFGQPILAGKEFSKGGLLYYWFYYIFMNGIWVVIPLPIVVRSWRKISQGLEAPSKKERKSKASFDRHKAA